MFVWCVPYDLISESTVSDLRKGTAEGVKIALWVGGNNFAIEQNRLTDDAPLRTYGTVHDTPNNQDVYFLHVVDKKTGLVGPRCWVVLPQHNANVSDFIKGTNPLTRALNGIDCAVSNGLFQLTGGDEEPLVAELRQLREALEPALKKLRGDDDE